jgi:aconitate hydratase
MLICLLAIGTACGMFLMGSSVAEQIISQHLVEGRIEKGTEIGIKIDQTLTQDLQGPVAYLQFEAMGFPRVRTKLSLSYVDHNVLQTTYENFDDHKFLRSAAAKYGVIYSRPGNGICHQVHLERFAIPSQTLLGTDSHTPTCGAVGMLAIGAGAMEIAVAMGGGLLYMKMPRIVGIELRGKLSRWVSSKDVILEVIRRITVKGGREKILEYYGDGIRSLSVPERATIANMGAETGATTSVFPSDSSTKHYLQLYGREKDFTPLNADNPTYDENLVIDMETIQPLIAKPSSPDNVCRVDELEGKKVDQVLIGSCTNSSFKDLVTVASILKGKHVHPDVSVAVVPGSRQVLQLLAENGSLKILIDAGVRILQSACGPCIGLGEAPSTNAVSLRTFNRNFKGRSGTKDDFVYLVSPEVAAVAALTGEITDPRRYGSYPDTLLPMNFQVDDSMLIFPPKSGERIELVRGPNIKPLPTIGPIEDKLEGEILAKLGDNVTTDDILPAGPKILSLRSNIPATAEHMFENLDPNFVPRAKAKGGGFIVAGENYGQGSSREHAAAGLMYLRIKAVIAKSVARIHNANLINYGIVPLIYTDAEDIGKLNSGDRLSISNVRAFLKEGGETEIKNITRNVTCPVKHLLSERQSNILIDGGLLNYTKNRQRS